MNQAVLMKDIAAAVRPAKKTGKAKPTVSELAREWIGIQDILAVTVKMDTNSAADDFTTSTLCERQSALEDQLDKSKAVTIEDVIAHLEAARRDMVQFKFDGVAYSDKGDAGDRLHLRAIDNALRVLRTLPATT